MRMPRFLAFGSLFLTIAMSPAAGQAAMACTGDSRVGLVGEAGLAKTGSPALLGSVVDAGMRYEDVALWVFDGQAAPRRVQVERRYKALAARPEIGGGALGEMANPPTFTNPSIECVKGRALLREAWYVLGVVGVTCWSFDALGDVRPLAALRDELDDQAEAVGTRRMTLTKVNHGHRSTTVSSHRTRAATDDLSTCQELLREVGDAR